MNGNNSGKYPRVVNTNRVSPLCGFSCLKHQIILMRTGELSPLESPPSFVVWRESDEPVFTSVARNLDFDGINAFTPTPDDSITAVENKDVFDGDPTCDGDSGSVGPPSTTLVSSMDFSQRKKTPVVNCTLF